MDRAVLRLRIFDFFCSAAACETGGRSGGNPAIWVPDATFVGVVMGGGKSSMNWENVFRLACAISLSASKHHEVNFLLYSVCVQWLRNNSVVGHVCSKVL